MEVIEGTVLKPGTQILINAGGYVNSKRKAKDGSTFFGVDTGLVILFFNLRAVGRL